MLLTPIVLGIFRTVDDHRRGSMHHIILTSNGLRQYAWPALLVNALVLFRGLLLQTYGYQAVKHAQLANMTVYLEILTVFLLQHFVFGDPVNALAAIGAGIIVVVRAANVALLPAQTNTAAAKSVAKLLEPD